VGRTLRIGAIGMSVAALAAGVAGTAAAKQGADDPPGDDRGGLVGAPAAGQVDDSGHGGSGRDHPEDDGHRSGGHAGDDSSAGAATSLSAGAVVARRRGGSRDDVRRAGRCTGASSVKIKLSPENGRLEVEGEVDQNRNGVRWTWSMRRGTRVIRSGRAITRPPSRSFEVRRVVADLRGTDTIRFRARSRSGEVCVATARI